MVNFVFFLKKSSLINLVFVLLFSLLDVQAEPTILLRGNESKIMLDGYVSIFVDEKLNPTGKSYLDFNYQKIKGESFRFGYKYCPHWFKIDLANTTNQVQKLYFVIENPTINSIDFYLHKLNESNPKYSLKTGIDFPFQSRGFLNREFVFQFELNPNTSYSIYCQAHNTLSNLALPLRLYTESGFFANENFFNLFWKSYFGFILIAAFTAFVLFVFFKEAIYLLYAAYLVFFFLFQFTMEGYAFQYLWPESPWMAEMSKLVFIAAGLVFCANFILAVLSDAKHKLTVYKRITHLLSLVLLGLVAFRLIFDPTVETQRFMVKILNLTYFSILATFFHAIFIRFRQNFKPATYILIALTPLMLVMIMAIFKNYGLMPHFLFFTYIFPVASVFEIFVFFLALSNRFDLQRREGRLIHERFKHYEHLVHEKMSNGIKVDEKKVYQNNVLDEAELEHNYGLLINHIEKKKSYLDPELTLAKLSKQLDISLHELSYTINRKENKNFNEFINSYRIALAKEKLNDPNFAFMSVEGIGADCGFSTKTTFYNAFKKNTNQSPAEYRKMNVIKI